MDPHPAAGRIHEDHLLNFIVNLLTGAFTLELGANAEVEADDLWEVIVGACIDGTSISTLCASSEAAPSPNDVLYHLRTKVHLDPVHRVGNDLLRWNATDLLPPQVEFAVDLHLRPYYGDEAETDGLYHSEAKAGTTAFHAYATLYARVRNKRYTLAVRRVTDGDTPSDVLREFLAILDEVEPNIRALYLDREFYDSSCLALLQAHNLAYIMPIVRWGPTIKAELSQGWSRVIEHDLAGEVTFPIYIDATYLQGRYDEHGVARHGYAAEAPFVDTPSQARYHYTKRFGIESSYRLGEQTTASTTTQDPAPRFLFVVVSLLLQNVWRYLHWEYVSSPRRGGRQLWEWPFEEFVDMVTRAVWRAVGKRQSVPANRPPGERFER